MNEDILERIRKLEYHQSLLLKMISSTEAQFYKLIIEKQLSQEDVQQFYIICEKMSNVIKEQKAEGFLYFYPLFEEFKSKLHPNLHAEEVIPACLVQQLFQPLMSEFKKYI